MVHVNKQGHRGCYDNAKVGKFHPIHKDKYIGQYDPMYKSGLELKMMRFLDRSPNVISWSYEKLSIKYLDKSQQPNKIRNYYIDFTATIKTPRGQEKVWIEVKSSKEAVKPKENADIRQKITWIKNQCKWNSARLLAESKGCSFKVITDKELD